MVGGDAGTRTPDPLHAKQVLYQLSYIPTAHRPSTPLRVPRSGDTGAVEDCTRQRGHLSKRMRNPPHPVAFTLAAVVLLAAAQPVQTAPAFLVAANRCNSQMIDDASSRVRDYDRRGPGSGSAKLLQRYGALAELISTLNEERDVLDSMCASDAQRAPLFAQIAAYSAWALALESDVAAKLNASCPAAATALPAMMLADAWLALAMWSTPTVGPSRLPSPTSFQRFKGVRPQSR